jgi:hypothetical protein
MISPLLGDMVITASTEGGEYSPDPLLGGPGVGTGFSMDLGARFEEL